MMEVAIYNTLEAIIEATDLDWSLDELTGYYKANSDKYFYNLDQDRDGFTLYYQRDGYAEYEHRAHCRIAQGIVNFIHQLEG